MSRYAGVGSNHLVVKSAYKHTEPIIDEPTPKQKKAYTSQYQSDLQKKYELISYLRSLGVLNISWNNNCVTFTKTISGVDYDQYREWCEENKNNETSGV